MALEPDRKKKTPAQKMWAGDAARGAQNRAAASAAADSAAQGVGNWFLGRPDGMKPEAPSSMFKLPDYTSPNPTNAPVMLTTPAQPVAAQAQPAVPGAMSTQARQSPSGVPAPRTLPAIDQAHAAEVNARTATQPPPTAVAQELGAPAPNPGGAAPSGYFDGSNGVRRTIDAQGGVVGGNANQTPINAQSFGTQQNVAQPTFQRALPEQQRGGVASTFGQSVRMLPDDNVVQQAPNAGSFTGPQQMAEQYNSREAREASQKMIGDLDSQRFRLEMIAGNPGRRGRAALAALGQNAQQQTSLAQNAERISADAVQGRAARNNQFGIADMQQQGDLKRTLIDADTRTSIAGAADATDRERIAAGLVQQPSLQQDTDGYYMSVTGSKAQAVTDASGNPVRGLKTQESDPRLQVAQMEQVTALTNQFLGLDPLTGQIADGGGFRAPTPDEIARGRAWAQTQLSGAQGGGGAKKVSSKAEMDALPKGAQFIGPDGVVRTKP